MARMRVSRRRSECRVSGAGENVAEVLCTEYGVWVPNLGDLLIRAAKVTPRHGKATGFV